MLEDVRSRARSYFEDASPAHDWQHVERVGALAETLLECHPREADERTVTLAVFLHDIGREREDRGEIDDHATWGATEAGTVLEDVGARPETIERVQHCIRAHRYSNDVDPETLEARLLSDADNLDALGAVGLARVFSYGGENGTAIHGPTVSTDGNATGDGQSGYDHLHEKILDLPERMYTDPGRELALERARFVREFADRLEAEVAGER
ncbi:HD domain-containing protein [Natrarchaeobius chitinivorans]|uniref:HD domain-containing protein n=1 Tax=Natrarchaeobius chitinivorans TaxID=1679083 RepID=A0A3N6M0W3_NATCH|nr:HD domain-containing protein [Natrarchaeobius chitinivorans]RQG95247.1 HD domain-containing protein [Natrarchaeobius chitinivorans]